MQVQSYANLSTILIAGLFEVNMPLLYGEGEKAFRRLQENIIQQSKDESIFAWTSSNEDERRGLLAKAPSEFARSGGVRPVNKIVPRPPYTITNSGIEFYIASSFRDEFFDFVDSNIYPVARQRNPSVWLSCMCVCPDTGTEKRIWIKLCCINSVDVSNKQQGRYAYRACTSTLLMQEQGRFQRFLASGFTKLYVNEQRSCYDNATSRKKPKLWVGILSFSFVLGALTMVIGTFYLFLVLMILSRAPSSMVTWAILTTGYLMGKKPKMFVTAVWLVCIVFLGIPKQFRPDNLSSCVHGNA